MNKNYNVLNFAIMILLLIFNVLFISTVELICTFPINPYGFILSLLFTIFEAFIILKKMNKPFKTIAISISLFVLLIFISILVSGNILDKSWDSNAYHKSAIGQLKNGWNPFYDTFYKPNSEIDDICLMQSREDIWTHHYPKGIWIFAANVYSLTNNIESGKCISILIAVLTFSFSYFYLSDKIKQTYNIILSLLIAINPVFFSQCMTFYNDGILGNCIIILIFTFLSIIENKSNKKNLYLYICLFITLVLLINIKFTGLVYAGIYSLCYYIYFLFSKNHRKKYLIDITIIGFLALIIGICFVGYPTYIKNTLDHHNPFFPLLGEGKVDIMTKNTPPYLLEMNRFERLLAVMFSKANLYQDTEFSVQSLKFPFTFSLDELTYSMYPDSRRR